MIQALKNADYFPGFIQSYFEKPFGWALAVKIFKGQMEDQDIVILKLSTYWLLILSDNTLLIEHDTLGMKTLEQFLWRGVDLQEMAWQLKLSCLYT